jgi:xylan 1,4-beta-xylosidase
MMKLFSLLSLLVICSLSGISQSKTASTSPQSTTVLLSGDYADPSILKDGQDYYMTNTSLNYFPGLRVWHSTDLIHWKPIGYALNKYVGEVWAPDFVKHGDTYYIYFPAYPGTNWVVTAKSPYGPWSEPVDLKVKGIDPGHVVGQDGKRYLYFNDGKVAELNSDGLSLKEEPKKVYTGWQYPKDWVVECMCAESPKLHFNNGWYYLTTAQGGTSGPSTSHMVVQARSKSPLGPWENSPHNPIVHTYSSAEKWWSKGHGTIVQKPDNGWAVVYHAYEKNNLPHGRQVLMEDLAYGKDEWYQLKRNPQIESKTVEVGNLKTQSDDFNHNKLHEQWQFSEMYNWKDVQLQNGKLVLLSDNDSIKAMHTTTATSNYEIQIELTADSTIEAGLVAYYRENGYAGINMKGKKLSRVGTSLKYGSPAFTVNNIRFLKLKVKDYDLTMSYSSDGVSWNTFPNSMNLQTYQHNNLGRFSSLKPGIYWKGKGKLIIDNFTFTPL